MKRSAAVVLWWSLNIVIGTSGFSPNVHAQGVYARANCLKTIQRSLFDDVKREFKTRYDGSIWAKACRDPGYAQHLGLNRKELNAFVFERINGRKDITKIKPLEKWALVHAVAGMTEAYLQGAKAFVRATRNDCNIVLKGLRREFPQ